MLLTKSLHFIFSRLGWCGGGLVIAVVFYLLGPELAKMMAPSGASGASSSEATSVDKGPTRNEASSSGSESWKQYPYLNLSSDNEGNGSAAPSTDRTPRHKPTSDQTVDQQVQTQPPAPAAGPSEPRRDPSLKVNNDLKSRSARRLFTDVWGFRIGPCDQPFALLAREHSLLLTDLPFLLNHAAKPRFLAKGLHFARPKTLLKGSM
uniref:Uncharacterized protein n=1 Tax=Ombrophytum subterraneum TaxID=50155 RepID=A0A6M8PLH8_9MAGN|nr:hypothetical protein [Ombrophytum subterraneum]